MNERAVLEQRLATLDGLLDGSRSLLGPAGAALGQQLRAKWETERRLLVRLLAETPGADVRATIALWQARTAAFLARSEAPQPSWTDREGQCWLAEEVLALLADLVERLDGWLAADEPLPDEEAGEEDPGGVGR